MLVTGRFIIGEILGNHPERLAALEEDSASRSYVCRYLEGASRPAAIQILDPRRFVTPLQISALDIRRPPQSYAWVKYGG